MDTVLVSQSILELSKLLMTVFRSILFNETWQVLQFIVVTSDDLGLGCRGDFWLVQLLGVHGGLQIIQTRFKLFIFLS